MGISLNSFTGGLDVNSIISQLMAVQEQPLLIYQQQLSTLGTQQQSVNQIQSDASALESAVQQLTLSSTIGAKTATSGSSAVSAQAGSDAANGTFDVWVKQLATATRVTSTSPDGVAAAAVGEAVSLTAPLSSAGFSTPVTNGTFSINGVSFTVGANTVLDDPNNAANSLVNEINSSNAGVTASVVNDAYGRPNTIQLVSKSGQAITLGSSSDTSNFLTASGLLGGAIVGNTATSVTGNSVGAGALSATITINGVAVAINQADGTYTGGQNAAAIATAINNANLGVTASVTGANGDQLQMTQTTAGSQGQITLALSGTNAGSLGLTAGTYQNGTDKVVGATLLGAIDPSTSLSANTFATPLVPDGTGGGSFTINGVSISWSVSDSLNDVLNRINSSSAGVRATYDPSSDRVTLSSNQTGGSAISLHDVSGNFLESLHLMTNATTSVAQQLGQNAIVNISGVNNGNDLTVPSNTVTGYIPGVTLTLQQQTTGPVAVTIGQDTSTTTTAVQSFVSAVNTLFTDINNATKSDPTAPGPLAGDPEIEGIESAVQEMINGVVTSGASGYQDLASVGVTTGAIGTPVADSYTLQLDTTALTQALQSNPNAVSQLFIGDGTNQGVAVQLNNYLNGLIGSNGLFADRTTAISSSQQDLNNTITNMQDLLNQQQQALQTEFAQLQTTLGVLHAQDASVAAQVANLGVPTTSSSSSGGM